MPTTRSKMTNVAESKVACELLTSTAQMESTIPVFEGDTGMPVKMWFENFEKTASVYEWNAQQKYVYAKNRMVKSAELFLKTVAVSDYESLKRVLKKEFERDYSSAEIHDKLRDRKMSNSESFYEYILNMRSIGFMGNVDDKSIIKYIVDGIKGKSENKIVLYSATNYMELRKHYEVYEKIFVKNMQKHNKNGQTYNNSSNNKEKAVHCYNCGSKEHKKNECTNDQKCFKCNQTGHIAKECNNKRSVNCTWQHEMTKEVIISGKRLQGLIDGGADISLVKDCVFDKYFKQRCTLNRQCNIQISGLGRAKIMPTGTFDCEIELDGLTVKHKLTVVPSTAINFEVIIGFDILRQFRYSSDERGYTFESIVSTHESDIKQIMNINVEEKYDMNMPQEIKDSLSEMEAQYTPSRIATSPVLMKIHVENEEPIFAKPCRLPMVEQDKVDKQLREWLETGIIRKSTSQYSSRIKLTDKKDGTKRLCVDYRRINKIALKDRFPVPNMEEVIDNLSESTIYSVIDIKNAYLHVPVEESSKKYLAFVTKDGMYEFNYAPFGFCNSSANFIRFINAIFQDLINKNMLQIYVDDIIIGSNDYETGLKKLQEVLKMAEQNGLMINWQKSEFLKKRVEFLGYIIEKGTIRPNDEKIRAIQRFPQPRNVKDMQSFLGLVGFFRKFVKNFSLVATPLFNLLKKDVKFDMGQEQIIAMNTLKECLATQPVLKIFSVDAKTELHTDASKNGFGAILLQEFESKFHPIYYYSKKTTEAESKLHSYQLEAKSAFLAMKKFRHYLLGLKFTLVTDCAALKYITTKEDISPAVTRYVMYMQEFEFEVKHRSGDRMQHVDALSRYTVMTIRSEEQSKHKLMKAQDSDSGIRAIKDMLEKGPYKEYRLVGGILCKVVEGHEVVVVPRYMETEIISKAHENGHFGLHKTIHSIRQHYHISHLESKVKRILANCIRCILYNKKTGKQEGFLTIIEKGDLPLHTLHVDHLGPLDATTKMYKYIFAIVDGFSKFVWLYPTKTTNVNEVLNKMKLWQEVFGNPDRIISDKGAAFTSNAFKEFCDANNIEHITATAGIPRGNGQIERVNRTIISVLSKLSAEQSNQWYKKVGQVQRAINGTVHRSTKYTPHEVLLGVKMKNTEVDQDIIRSIEEEMTEEFMIERKEVRDNAREQIEQVQKEYKKTFDKRRKKPINYKEGDLVAIKRTQFVAGKKLANEFMGPYEITKVKRTGRYEVVKKGDGDGPIKTSTANDHIKPWQHPQEYNEDVSSSGSEDD